MGDKKDPLGILGKETASKNDPLGILKEEEVKKKNSSVTVPSASTSTVAPTTAPLASEGGTSGLGITPSASQGIPSLPGRVNPQTLSSYQMPSNQEDEIAMQKRIEKEMGGLSIPSDEQLSKVNIPGTKQVRVSNNALGEKKYLDVSQGETKQVDGMFIPSMTFDDKALIQDQANITAEIEAKDLKGKSDYFNKVYAPIAKQKGLDLASDGATMDFYLNYLKDTNPAEYKYNLDKFMSLRDAVEEGKNTKNYAGSTKDDQLDLERFEAELITKGTRLKTEAYSGFKRETKATIENYYQDKVDNFSKLSSDGDKKISEVNSVIAELDKFPKNENGEIITDATNRKQVEQLIEKQQKLVGELETIQGGIGELKNDKDFNDAYSLMQDADARQEEVSKRYYDLATNNPEAFKNLPEYKALIESKAAAKKKKDYMESMNITTFGIGEGIGQAVTNFVSKIAYIPKSLGSDEYGITDRIYDSASQNIQDFNDEYITTPTEMDKPLLEDGKWSLKYLPGKLAGTATDMALMILTTKGIGGATGALPLVSESVASAVGQVASGYTMSAQGYYEEAKQSGMSEADANSIAREVAILDGFLELVSPNEKLLSPFKLKDDFASYAKALANGATKKKALAETTRKIIEKNIPENFQELLQTTNAHVMFTSNELSKANESARQSFGEEVVETVIMTTLLTTLMGGKESVTTRNRYNNEALYMAAFAPDKMMSTMSKNLERGLITQEQHDALTKKITIASEALKKMGDVPQEKKIKTLPAMVEKMEEEAKKKETDTQFQAPIDEKIKTKEEEINQVLNEPSEADMLDENIAYLQELEAEGVIDDNQKEELDNLLTQKKRVAPPTYAEGLAAVKAKANGVIGNVPKGVVINKEEVTDFNSESGNKLVSSDGEGLILYHNTNKGEVSESEGHKGTVGGVFLTPKETAYEDYGDNKIVSVANIKNPYYASSAVHGDPEKIKAIKDQGYDAIINHPLYEYEKPKGVSPDEYIAQQNVNNNVEGKDNRGDLDLSKAREIIVFDKANIKELGSINNKTREYSKKEGPAFETDKTEQRQPIELSVETPKVEAVAPEVKEETPSAENDIEFEKLNESDFEENGDLTDDGFTKAENALKGVIKNIANKYKIPVKNLLSAYNIKNGGYFSSLKGILNVGENRDINEVIKIVKDISFEMFPDKIDELNEQINKYKDELLDSIVNNTPFKANKGLQKVVFALTDIDERWNELKNVTKTEFTPYEEVKPTPKAETPTKKEEAKPEVKAVELEARFPGGMPRKMEFKDGEWKQNVGGEYTTVAKQVQEQAQKVFNEQSTSNKEAAETPTVAAKTEAKEQKGIVREENKNYPKSTYNQGLQQYFINDIDTQTVVNKEVNKEASKLDGGIDELMESLPTVDIPLDKIVPTQNGIDSNRLDRVKESNKLPLVIKNGDLYYIEDGHHRIINALLSGEAISAKVFENKESKEPTKEVKAEIVPEVKAEPIKAEAKPTKNVDNISMADLKGLAPKFIANASSPTVKKSIEDLKEAISELSKTKGYEGFVKEKQAILDEVNSAIEKVIESSKIPVKEEVKPIEVKKEAVVEPTKKEEVSGSEFSVPVNEIETDTKRFQNRKGSFSENSVKKIVDNFDENKLDAVTLWKDPTDGKTYVISGHSRLEAHKQLGKDKIKSKYFVGTEQEAIDFGRTSNVLGTQETLTERANYYRGLRKEGKKNSEIGKEAKKNEGSNAVKVLSISHLNPDGALIQAINQMEGSDVQSENKLIDAANWMGDARMRNPQLTDAHEQEMYDWLIKEGAIDKIKSKVEFGQRISNIVGGMFFDAKNPLNLKNKSTKGALENEVDDEINGVKSEIKELEKERDSRTKPATSKRLDEITAQVKLLNAKLGKLNEALKAAKEGDKQQVSIFDQIEEVINEKEVTDEAANEYINNTEKIEESEAVIEAIEAKAKDTDGASEKELEQVISDIDKELGTSQSNKQPVVKPTKVEKVAEKKPIESNKKEDIIDKEAEAAMEADKSVKEDENLVFEIESVNIAKLKAEKDEKMIEQRAVTALAKSYKAWKDKKITYSTYTTLKNKIEDVVEGKVKKSKLEGRLQEEVAIQRLADVKKKVKDKLLGEGYNPSQLYSAPGINPKVINDLIDGAFNLAEKAIKAGFTIKEAVEKASKLIKSSPAYKAAVRNKQIDEKEFESKISEAVNEETEALKKAFEEEQKKRAEEKALDENAPIEGDIKTGREKERANAKMQKESGKLSEVFDRISDTNKKYKETSLSKSKEYIDTILDDFEANGELISLAEDLLGGREVFLPEVKHEAERLLAGRLYDLAKTKINDPIAQDDILSKAAKLYTKAMEAKTLAATQTAAGRIGNEKISSSPELLTNMVAEKITEIQKGTITPEEVKKTAEAANEINNIFDMEQMKEQMKKDIMTEFGEKTFGSKEEAERFANFSKSLLTDSNDC